MTFPGINMLFSIPYRVCVEVILDLADPVRLRPSSPVTVPVLEPLVELSRVAELTVLMLLTLWRMLLQ